MYEIFAHKARIGIYRRLCRPDWPWWQTCCGGGLISNIDKI